MNKTKLTIRLFGEEVEGRVCRGCAKTLPVFDFAADKTRTDGLKSKCRACRRAEYVKVRPVMEEVHALAQAHSACSAVCREWRGPVDRARVLRWAA